MHATSHDQWIPRDDMAVIARCSVDTIKRDEKKLAKLYQDDGTTYESRTDAGDRVLVNVADFLRLGRIRPEDLATGATPAESAELVRAREVITQLKVQAADLAASLRRADAEVDGLRDQLGVKDRQLSRQADQITGLIHSLGRIGGAA